ncbi:MAG: hypothetical protein WC325_05405 [Candidatus Bathyarchaeia archaeon]|jgi:hypothetical protein
MVNGKCALCNKNATLRTSHIIPRFVSVWLKQTSATGFLRGVKNPEKRIQDLPKLPLLCEDCEQIFSKLESYFARKVFYPVLNEQKKEIIYDESLLLFIISLSWRTLKTSYSDQVAHFPWIKKHLDSAEEDWRKCLIANSANGEQYEHHMFFVDYVKEANFFLPKKFQVYTMRATDSTLVSNQEVVFAMTHFPHIFFVSSIYPLKISGWKNTRISNTGKFTMKWEINDTNFGNFLVNRVKEKISSVVIGASSEDKIVKSLEKDPKRTLASETLLVMIEELKRTRQERIIGLPKTIQFLVDIVHRSAENPIVNAIERGRAKFVQNEVAEALSLVPLRTAKIIDALIESTINLADNNHKQESCDFETEELKVRFIVSICDSKDEQIDLLEKAMDALVNVKAPNDKRIIVVFSYNPNDDKMPYETSYYVD